MARAVLVANDTIARQKQQLEQAHKQVAALAPKAELMDKVLDTDQKIDVGQAAKILNLPSAATRSFNGSVNAAYSSAIAMSLSKSILTVVISS